MTVSRAQRAAGSNTSTPRTKHSVATSLDAFDERGADSGPRLARVTKRHQNIRTLRTPWTPGTFHPMRPAATMVLLSGAHGAIVPALQRPPGESTALVVTTGANPTCEGREPAAWLRHSLISLAAIGFQFTP